MEKLNIFQTTNQHVFIFRAGKSHFFCPFFSPARHSQGIRCLLLIINPLALFGLFPHCWFHSEVHGWKHPICWSYHPNDLLVIVDFLSGCKTIPSNRGNKFQCYYPPEITHDNGQWTMDNLSVIFLARNLHSVRESSSQPCLITGG